VLQITVTLTINVTWSRLCMHPHPPKRFRVRPEPFGLLTTLIVVMREQTPCYIIYT